MIREKVQINDPYVLKVGTAKYFRVPMAMRCPKSKIPILSIDCILRIQLLFSCPCTFFGTPCIIQGLFVVLIDCKSSCILASHKLTTSLK